jgi:hypothetical protein
VQEEGITSFIALVRIHKYNIYERFESVMQNESLSFILKTYKKTPKQLSKGAWDMVLDLIVLSFNSSRSKWKLESPMIESNMSKFESQTGEF